MNNKKINSELRNLTRDDIGYGDSEARLQDERKFQLLMHKQIESHEKINENTLYGSTQTTASC